MDKPGDHSASHDETLEGRAAHINRPLPNAPQFGPAQHGAVTEGPGSRVGRYKLIQKLGEGGFGVVFQAEQERPVRRTVAVKIIKLGMDTPQVIARFDAERQALAMMDHPNIAKVLDAGATDSGRPYFVMEMVKGVPITEYCDTHELATNDRLELFYAVCIAIQHAHQKGIIHRDLKPSNILVMLRDGKPVPKVIDFGIAKATSGRLTDMTLHTELSEMIGTPQYMSPEQAEMTALDIDTRSDIYSLGVLLYELLVGATPLDGHTLRSAALVDMQRLIREAEPPRPSVKLASLGVTAVKIAISRRTDAIRLGKTLRGELDWIVLKAMEKDRTRRYDTAQGLALDVRRYLNDEPILARPATALYRAQKFVRKHKTAAIAASLVVLVLVLGITGTSIGMYSASRAKEQAIAAEKTATEQRNHAVGLLEKVNAAEAKAQQAKVLAEQSAALAIAAKRESDISRARGRITEGDALGAAGDWSSARDAYAAARTEMKALGLSTRVAEFGLWDAYRNLPPPLAVKSLGTRPIVGAEWLADGRSAIALADDGRITIWDVPTGRTLRQFRDGGIGPCQSMALSPDGASLVTLRDQKVIVVWDVLEGKILKEMPQNHSFRRAVFSRDGKQIIVGGYRWAKILDFPTCNVLFESDKTPHQDYRFLALASPGSPLRLVGSWFGGVDSWDIQAGKVLKTAHGPTLEYGCAAISPDGAFIVFGDWTGTLRRWDFQADRLVDFTSKQESSMKSVVFTARDRVLSVDGDGWICEWDTTTRSLLRRLGKDASHSDAGLSVQPNGRTVLSPGPSGTVTLRSLVASREITSFSVRPRGWDETPGATAVLPDNCTAVIGVPGLLSFWDLPTTHLLSSSSEPWVGNVAPSEVRGLFPTFDGKVLCASGKAFIERLRLWDARTYQALPKMVEFKDKERLTRLRLSKDGRFAIGIDLAGAFHAWNVQTLLERPFDPGMLGGEPVAAGREMKKVTYLGLSPAIPGISFQHKQFEMTLRLQDPSTGEELRKLRHAANVVAAACSADERWIVTGDDTRFATFWELGRLSDYESFAPRLDAARAALAANPQDANALMTLGEWYAFRGEMGWGAQYLEAAAAGGAKISRLTLARCYWNLENLAAAEREFNAALAANEAPADYLRRCLNVIRPQSLQNSVAAVTELIGQKPRVPELYVQRAKIIAGAGRFAEATADYDKALELREDNVNWRFLRGCLRLYAGNQTGYLEDCKQMHELHIHNPDGSLSNQACKLCLLQSGAVANAGDIAVEIDARMKAETGDKHNEWHKLNKGMVEYRLGHYDDAVTWLEKARQSKITNAGIITAELFEAMATFKAGLTTKAGDQLNAAIRRMETELPKAGQGEISGVENWLICQIARREAEAMIH